MATFTKIPEADTPTITLNPQHKISKINDNVYGGFTEYVCPIIQQHPVPRHSAHYLDR